MSKSSDQIELAPGLTLMVDWNKVARFHGSQLVLPKGRWNVNILVTAEPLSVAFYRPGAYQQRLEAMVENNDE